MNLLLCTNLWIWFVRGLLQIIFVGQIQGKVLKKGFFYDFVFENTHEPFTASVKIKID